MENLDKFFDIEEAKKSKEIVLEQTPDKDFEFA